MNNREITELLNLYEIPVTNSLSAIDLVFTLNCLNDVCDASIRQDETIEQLRRRVTELEESLNRLRDGVRAVVNNIDQQLRTLRNRH